MTDFNNLNTNEILKEKTKIKDDAQIIGSSFLVMYGLTLLFNVIIIVLKHIFRDSGNVQALEILRSPISLQAMQIVFASTVFTLPFILIYRLANIRISDLMSFSLPQKGKALPLFLFGISFCSFANIAMAFAEALFEDESVSYSVPRPENPLGIYGFLLAFTSTVLVPAFVEEFACRGLMLGLLKKHGEGFAILASSLLFGLMHGNFEQIPFAFLVGLVLGFITIKSGTILIAMAVHGFNNFISIVFEYFLKDVPKLYQNVGYMIFLVICLLLGIFALFLLYGKDDGLYTLKPSKMKSGDGKKLLWFFSAITILIYVLICFAESFQYFEF